MITLMKKSGILLGIAGALMVFSACEKDQITCSNPVEQTFPVNGFNQISVSENFHATVRKGTVTTVRAEGCTDDLADMDVRVVDGELRVSYKVYRKQRNRVDLDITLPELTAIEFSGAAVGKVGDFGQVDRLEVYVDGAAEVDLQTGATYVKARVTGAGELSGSGQVNTLEAIAEGASDLRAYDWQAQKVKITANGASKAWVRPTQELIARASGTSHIYYKGNPATSDILTEGAAKVTRE